MARVALMVVVAMTLIVGGDTAGTIMTRAGVEPVFVAWSRFAMAVVVLAPFCGLQRSEWRAFLDWRVIFRAACIVIGIVCILTALRTEDIATAFGAFFIGPIVAFALSVLILKEQFSPIRAVLLIISFIGVLIVVRPGFGMTAGIGFALLAGTFHGLYLMMTKMVAGSYRPRFLLLSQLVIGAIVLMPFGAPVIPPMNGMTVFLVTISALGSAFGNLLIVLANRIAPATLIAPLIYCQIIIATFYGLTVFGTIPDGLTLIGLVVILASGFSTLWLAGRGR